MCQANNSTRNKKMTVPAYSVKPGDKINGVVVFDLLRRTFGGWYLPMCDGTRVPVKNQEQPININ